MFLALQLCISGSHLQGMEKSRKYMECLVHFLLIQFRIDSLSQCSRAKLRPPDSDLSRTSCFCPHPSVITVFSPKQTALKGENTPGFDSNEVNFAFVKVKTPLAFTNQTLQCKCTLLPYSATCV